MAVEPGHDVAAVKAVVKLNLNGLAHVMMLLFLNTYKKALKLHCPIHKGPEGNSLDLDFISHFKKTTSVTRFVKKKKHLFSKKYMIPFLFLYNNILAYQRCKDTALYLITNYSITK